MRFHQTLYLQMIHSFSVTLPSLKVYKTILEKGCSDMSRTQSNISDGALLGQSEGQQNVLEKTWQGRFRNFEKH